MNAAVKGFVRTVLPDHAYSALQRPYREGRQFVISSRFSKKVRNFGITHYCPVCRSNIREFKPFGVAQRLNALCPVCNSLERHRLAFIYFSKHSEIFLPPMKRMLHVAPEECLSDAFKESQILHYISADLAPFAMLEIDLTDIYFPAETFDVVYASHVFEHIVDDRKAMKETFRILKKGGWAILQVPIGAKDTFEDPTIVDPEDRERIYGQSDHVRIYGSDYYDRLRDAGFVVERRILPIQRDLIATRRFGLSPDEELTLCTKP